MCLLPLSHLSVYTFVHTELDSHCTDLQEILYLRFFQNSVKKIQVSKGTLHDDIVHL